MENNYACGTSQSVSSRDRYSYIVPNSSEGERSAFWGPAIPADLEAHDRNRTCSVALRFRGENILTRKLMLKIKDKAGSPREAIRNPRALMVARAFQQIHRIE